MKAILNFENDKFVEVENLQKVIKNGAHGAIVKTGEDIKNTIYSNGSITFVGDTTIAVSSAKLGFVQFID
ncbi:hypothetical protein [Macrococcoides caseolyticum]|uniref:Uncharacterized protein n=1 Tax=Macrococcoides caseolyticum TaxID=69966 RepID=A0ACC9MPI8_9STAP|nr:hypothetical protein [Macrococcus caseolyticus]PKE47277.1 hypothetical protein CW677_08855 [Macrococcus caseolyticus]PKE55484.1 hypothetical protein CW682_11710 [Macrococcus caseolyticus]PKE65509.1 hypothetical protein CW674_06065 [Macrococcus caseolyticus]PKF14044.1 hypothetical protein CW690_08845 [Macrococcus caseolyticus]PKF30296.1 hypothetical protein CW697_03285 [Macrococcus caseolyticus]